MAIAERHHRPRAGRARRSCTNALNQIAASRSARPPTSPVRTRGHAGSGANPNASATAAKTSRSTASRRSPRWPATATRHQPGADRLQRTGSSLDRRRLTTRFAIRGGIQFDRLRQSRHHVRQRRHVDRTANAGGTRHPDHRARYQQAGRSPSCFRLQAITSKSPTQLHLHLQTQQMSACDASSARRTTSPAKQRS